MHYAQRSSLRSWQSRGRDGHRLFADRAVESDAAQQLRHADRTARSAHDAHAGVIQQPHTGSRECTSSSSATPRSGVSNEYIIPILLLSPRRTARQRTPRLPVCRHCRPRDFRQHHSIVPFSPSPCRNNCYVEVRQVSPRPRLGSPVSACEPPAMLSARYRVPVCTYPSLHTLV